MWLSINLKADFPMNFRAFWVVMETAGDKYTDNEVR